MKLIHGDCLSVLDHIDHDSIDLIVTSPPYAMQRKKTYGGITEEDYPDWIEQIGIKLKKVMKPTGSFVLNIKEHVSDGRRSNYVMKSVLKLSEHFTFSDTYIWRKTNPFPTGSKRRLKDGFEYCFWFTKGKYKFYPDQVLVKSNSRFLESEKRRKNTGMHNTNNGSGMNMARRVSSSELVRPSNVIDLAVDTTNHIHPATFPAGLPEFFIKLMTDKNDIILDPFMGSGTTGVAALNNNRDFIGIEINNDYYSEASNRIAKIAAR